MENIISWITDPWFAKCFAYLFFPFIVAGIIWLWKMDGGIPKPKKKDKK